MELTAEDHERVIAAVAAAEAETDGEIVTIVAGRSDSYEDMALIWAVLAMLLKLAGLAWWPGSLVWLHTRLTGGWEDPSPNWYLTAALVSVALVFLIVRTVLAWDALRLAVTPGAVKARRVRLRAFILFRTGAEKRTKAATGVLLYLSLAERRAEIVADAAIHSKVAPEIWGDAMAALVARVKQGRPGEGMAEAVRQIGAVLAEHFPRSEGDTNELPDRLIVL